MVRTYKPTYNYTGYIGLQIAPALSAVGTGRICPKHLCGFLPACDVSLFSPHDALHQSSIGHVMVTVLSCCVFVCLCVPMLANSNYSMK